MAMTLGGHATISTPGTIAFTAPATGVDFYERVSNIIRARFKSQVADPYSPTLGVQYDNDAAFTKPQNTVWVRFTISFGDAFQVTLGANKRFRTPGLATASIFTPVGVGNQPAMELTDLINNAFRSLDDNGVVFQTPRPVKVGRQGKEWQDNVICPFYADDFEQ